MYIHVLYMIYTLALASCVLHIHMGGTFKEQQKNHLLEENPDIHYVEIFGIDWEYFFPQCTCQLCLHHSNTRYIFVYYCHMIYSNVPKGLLAAQCFVPHHPWQFSHAVMISTRQLPCHYFTGKERLSVLGWSTSPQIKLLLSACLIYCDVFEQKLLVENEMGWISFHGLSSVSYFTSHVSFKTWLDVLMWNYYIRMGQLN